MHVRNVRLLREAVEAVRDDEFDMVYWFSSRTQEANSTGYHRIPGVHWLSARCGTAACLAGHTNLLRGALLWRGPRREAVWLGLTWTEGQRLFTPWRVAYPLSVKHTTRRERSREIRRRFGRSQAVRTLAHMEACYAAGRGVVIDWEV